MYFDYLFCRVYLQFWGLLAAALMSSFSLFHAPLLIGTDVSDGFEREWNEKGKNISLFMNTNKLKTGLLQVAAHEIDPKVISLTK